MLSAFELFIARRYLRAKRREAAISVITTISVVGVAAGVMALVVALAINNGFRNTLQRNLLGATAHVSILEKEPSYGIEGWRGLMEQLQRLPGVKSVTPTLYGNIFISGPVQGAGAILKGIPVGAGQAPVETLLHLKQGSLDRLNEQGRPGLIVGSRLAQNAGLVLNSQVNVISPTGEMTPFGVRPKVERFRVVGIFETGFFELDAGWAYTSLRAAQMLLSVEDVVNSIELKLDNIQEAPAIAREAERLAGPKLVASTWMEQNRNLMNALRMERAVTVVTIGLIQLVAALNILIALIMMVMEKTKDIAILMSMGARREQIRNIFVLQGVLIGLVGTAIGLVLGHLICYFGEKYRWIRLDADVYALSYVPFDPRWVDSVWVAGIALLVSLVATLYPARNATRVVPVEILRYE